MAHQSKNSKGFSKSSVTNRRKKPKIRKRRSNIQNSSRGRIFKNNQRKLNRKGRYTDPDGGGQLACHPGEVYVVSHCTEHDIYNDSNTQNWCNYFGGVVDGCNAQTGCYNIQNTECVAISGIYDSVNNPNTNTFPDDVTELYNLKWLSISGAGIIGNIPHTIGNLTKLKSLNLAYNFITGPIPQEICNLESQNNLDFRDPEQFYIVGNEICPSNMPYCLDGVDIGTQSCQDVLQPNSTLPGFQNCPPMCTTATPGSNLWDFYGCGDCQ